jgi:sortase A
VLLRLGMLVAALTLAAVVAVTAATPLHSEPEGTGAVEEISFPDPASVERPVAVAKDSENTGQPNIRPEPAVSPELRELKRKISQRKAEQQRAQRRAAAQQEAERQKAVRQEAARQRAERQKAERERAEQRKLEQQKAERERQRIERKKAEVERTKSEKAAAARKVRSLPDGASGQTPAGQGRSKPAKSPGSADPAPRGGKMALSINSIGLRDSPIEPSDEQRVLDRSLMHLPQTSRPWERGKARNVYVVGHRMGWPGTKSWKIFYRLDELQRGDRLVLTAGDETYRYKVSEKLVVSPWDVWVTNPVRGRDLLSLQTCTGPNFSQRLIVRADRV